MIDKTERCVYIITDEVPVEEYGKTYRKQWMEKYRIKDDYYFNIPSGLKLEIKTVAIGVLQDGYAPLCNGDLVIVFNHSFCAERCAKTRFLLLMTGMMLTSVALVTKGRFFTMKADSGTARVIRW